MATLMPLYRRKMPDVKNRHRPQIQALNVEKKQQRFPSNGDISGPSNAAWRSNLAASSQRRNLVFTAHGDNIHVWAPHGALQQLGSQAAMVIKPVMKEPGKPGYISPLAPHTINNIIVDELGRDEVLVMATDSGNICAYHVEAIFSAMNRHVKSGDRQPFDVAEADFVSPFLVENVEQSAWGLSIHKFARLIAVSANTGQITVFAFALVDSASTKGSDNDSLGASDTMNIGQSDSNWVSIKTGDQLQQLQRLMPHNHRSRNLRLTYRGHFDNIPSVSFANFDLDASGTWMVSTDISNKILIWKIWESLWPWETYHPGYSVRDPPERGWTVIPLDPRTFREHQTVADACGCNPESTTLRSRVILDTSYSITEVPDASQTFVAKENRPMGTNILPDDIAAPDCCIDTRHDQGHWKAEVHDGHMDLSDVNGEADSSNESKGCHFEDGTSRCKCTQSLRLKCAPLSLFQEDNEHCRVAPGICDSFDEDYFDIPTPQALEKIAIHPFHPSFFPVLHLSERHITLIPYPVNAEFDIICRNALYQETSFRDDTSVLCDRFNMVKYVPELGLIVAASQKGRVAIISLTRHHELGYSFRVDWILPFCTQEQNHDRPRNPLLGITVSPMPGFEIPPDIPSIPRGVDPQDWAEFNYRILSPDDEESPSMDSGSSGKPASCSPDKCEDDDNPGSRSRTFPESEPHPVSVNGHIKPGPGNGQRDRTLPEIHAQASRAHRPDERWHGWHPSRHYRLLLLYFDHTVMSYEFWHDWKY